MNAIKQFYIQFRLINLGLIIFLQVIFRFIFLPDFSIKLLLPELEFWALIFALLCITSGGYLINDIFDIKTDLINAKKRISRQVLGQKSTYYYYAALNFLGVFVGCFISFKYANYFALLCFLSVPILLYIYAKSLKPLALVGNLVTSLMIALSCLLYLSFEIELSNFSLLVVKTSVYFAVMSFCINLSRELIKDIVDIKGDYACNMTTLPIVLGKQRTKTIAFSILLLIVAFSIVFFNTYYLENHNLIFGAYGLIILPNIVLAWQTSRAKSPQSFVKLSRYYKFVSVLGICTLFFFSF